eukprot:759683-Hanusia_phi.AAC.4
MSKEAAQLAHFVHTSFLHRQGRRGDAQRQQLTLQHSRETLLLSDAGREGLNHLDVLLDLPLHLSHVEDAASLDLVWSSCALLVRA